MTFEQMRDRYENDNLFHTVVDMLQVFLMQGKVTVNELRDAATFAGYRFEFLSVRPTLPRSPR